MTLINQVVVCLRACLYAQSTYISKPLCTLGLLLLRKTLFGHDLRSRGQRRDFLLAPRLRPQNLLLTLHLVGVAAWRWRVLLSGGGVLAPGIYESFDSFLAGFPLEAALGSSCSFADQCDGDADEEAEACAASEGSESAAFGWDLVGRAVACGEG
jgi:hypothetical protein